MKAALYARVSTTEEEDKQHPENQLLKLREWVSRKGWEVYKEYTDHGHGADMHRPALDDMMKDARQRLFDVVVVTKLDRIMRSIPNFRDVHAELERFGVGFMCTDQQIDTTGPEGRLFTTLLLAFAEYELDLIKSRTRDGLARARVRLRAEGKNLGRPPHPLDIERAQALLAGGSSIRLVALELGVSSSTLRRRLRQIRGGESRA